MLLLLLLLAASSHCRIICSDQQIKGTTGYPSVRECNDKITSYKELPICVNNGTLYGSHDIYKEIWPIPITKYHKEYVGRNGSIYYSADSVTTLDGTVVYCESVSSKTLYIDSNEEPLSFTSSLNYEISYSGRPMITFDIKDCTSSIMVVLRKDERSQYYYLSCDMNVLRIPNHMLRDSQKIEMTVYVNSKIHHNSFIKIDLSKL